MSRELFDDRYPHGNWQFWLLAVITVSFIMLVSWALTTVMDQRELAKDTQFCQEYVQEPGRANRVLPLHGDTARMTFLGAPPGCIHEADAYGHCWRCERFRVLVARNLPWDKPTVIGYIVIISIVLVLALI